VVLIWGGENWGRSDLKVVVVVVVVAPWRWCFVVSRKGRKKKPNIRVISLF